MTDLTPTRAPAAWTERAGGTTRMTDQHRRALALWDGAPPETRRAGAEWYPAVAGRACALVPELPAETTLSALALLSPRVTFAQNIRDLETLITGRPWAYTAFGRNVSRAQAVLAGAPFDTVVGAAPKTRAFRLNLLGDTHEVTVDTWMRTALLGLEHGARDSAPRLSAARYRALATVLQECAERVNTEPRTFQATVWIAARGAAY